MQVVGQSLTDLVELPWTMRVTCLGEAPPSKLEKGKLLRWHVFFTEWNLNHEVNAPDQAGAIKRAKGVLWDKIGDAMAHGKEIPDPPQA